MPPKRGTDEQNDAKGAKKRRRRKPQRDWRCPIFYWRGTLKAQPSTAVDGASEQPVSYQWKGVWVASEDGIPSQTDFDESTNAFTQATTLQGQCWDGYNGKWDGSYLLDQGGGLGHETVKDLEHEYLCKRQPGSQSEVTHMIALGNTPFGRFVSLGKIEGDILTLARRYVADDDPRSQWTIDGGAS